jgi:Polyketide cyclase / dehydrase and lipid transport
VDGFPARPVSVSAHIPVPPAALFRFVSDTRNDLLWCQNVETVDLVEGSKVEVGARFRFHQHLDRPGAKRTQFDVDVEVIEMGERTITWEANDRFQRRTISLTVEPEGSGSRITQVTRATFLRPPGLAKWLYPLLARRIFTGQFRDLGAYFEENRDQSR